MDFLSNLYNKTKDVISGIGQSISDTAIGLRNQLGTGALGNVFSSLKQNSTTPTIANITAKSKTQQTLMPNITTPYGPATVSRDGVYRVNTPYGVAPLTELNAKGQQNPVTPQQYYEPAVRPMTPQSTVNANGDMVDSPLTKKQSLINQGYSPDQITGSEDNPLFVGGKGVSSIMSTGTSSTTPSGGITPFNGGFSGGSSFNGVTSSVGGAPGGSVVTVNPDEKKNNKQKQVGGMQIITPPPPSLKIPSLPSEFDINTVQKYVSDNAKILATPEALTADDRANLSNNIEQAIAALKQRQDAANVTPDQPVIDTKEQMDYLMSLTPQEQMSAKQAMDAARLQVNLPTLEAQRLETLKQIQATNEAFQSIYDDIKNNPNLPKGLAQRRLAELQTQQKTRITQLANQMDIFNQQISDANQVVNREFQIFTSDQAERNRQQDNARQTIQLLISSGAFGAMSDAELQKYSVSTGIPMSGLKSVREKVKNDSKVKPVIREDSKTGNTIAIDEATGKTLWRNTDTKSPAGTGSGTSRTPSAQFVAEGRQILNNSKMKPFLLNGVMTPGDGKYANTEDYVRSYNQWTGVNGYSPESFFSNYPPDEFINPKDSTVPNFIKDKLSGSSRDGLNFKSSKSSK